MTIGNARVTLVHSGLIGETGDLERGWSYFIEWLVKHEKEEVMCTKKTH